LKKKRLIVIAFAVLLLGVGAFVYYGQWKRTSGELFYSGTIESTNSELSFQVAGRVIQVLVDEGQAVKKDQVLAVLDTSEYQAGVDQAKANLTRTERNLNQMKTVLEINRKTFPADVIRAEAGVSSARDTMVKAKQDKERYDQLYERRVVSQKEWESMRLNYDTARARLTDAEAVLNQAKSNLKRIDVAEREVEAAGAQIQASKAALDLAEIQMKRTRLTAPYDGTIVSRNVEPGYVVSPARQVFTLSDLSSVKLKIFVGETEIGKVKPGQKADVKVDTFPKKVYKGFVSYISPEGEFTPKIIQTQKERVKLVYLVQVTIPNPEHELKTGMPADAWLH
jgi:HlyD family secretion protein